MNLNNNSNLNDIIENHENQNIEFKESFRWNLYKKQIDRNIIKKITSSICGFLVSKEGGRILIGVSDDRKIKGIEFDIKSYDKVDPIKGKDKLLTDIGEKIRNNIGIKFINYCIISFRKIQGKQIIIIDVQPYEGPVVHLKKELYVRITNTTLKLSGREAYDYLKSNFDYKKFRLDLEYVFFNMMRYFKLARNIVFRKREKYYSLFLITIFYNLFWYCYLFYDYTKSEILFPITILTIFILTLNFNIDLFFEYKNSSKTERNRYIPNPSKKFIIITNVLLIVISGLLSLTLFKLINLLIQDFRLIIFYSILILILIISYISAHSILKRDLIYLENLNKLKIIRNNEEFEI